MSNHFSEEKYQELEKSVPKEVVPKMDGLEIEEIRSRIEKLEAQLKRERTPEERETMVKKEIKTYFEKFQKLPDFASPMILRDEAEEITKFPPTEQVGALVSLVFEKGIREAISVARSLDNPAILDEFHDILVDRYYQILIEKRILKSS